MARARARAHTQKREEEKRRKEKREEKGKKERNKKRTANSIGSVGQGRAKFCTRNSKGQFAAVANDRDSPANN